MAGETNLAILLNTMKPKLHPDDYVFCVVKDLSVIDMADALMLFREQEGNTVILKKEVADGLSLDYSFIASWIELTVHSSLEAVGLTAAFSKALADQGISCNVIAAFYHDHIFVEKSDRDRAMEILFRFSEV